ncbi:MAG: DUF1295 domain-containing protein [Acidobacteriota bacterium]
MLEAWLVGVAWVFAMMTVLWLVSLRIEDVSIIDIAWGPAFAVAAWSYALRGDAVLDSPVRLLPLVLVTVWALRLALHIGLRHQGEDRRYQKMRKAVGATFRWRSLVTVFFLQAALASVIGLPLLFALLAPRPDTWTALDVAGLLIWLVGFSFEALGDWQLTRFRADSSNRGKVLNTGLWRYTRHPNYFGDACLWWGFGVLALNAQGGLMLHVATVFSVLLMTFFLLRVSGVTLLERDISERRPAYREYIERTSAFIPWPPKA